MKLSIALGAALFLVLSAFFAYRTVMVAKIEKHEIELQTCINNQSVLEGKITEQNSTIQKQIDNAKKTQAQIQTLNNQYQNSQKAVSDLRNKFARHNLEGMALAKPTLLQGKVNKATARVLENLTAITNPDQFNEEAITDTDSSSSN